MHVLSVTISNVETLTQFKVIHVHAVPFMHKSKSHIINAELRQGRATLGHLTTQQS